MKNITDFIIISSKSKNIKTAKCDDTYNKIIFMMLFILLIVVQCNLIYLNIIN